MSLSGWDNTKKLELIIDHTKVDETLTDFPLLISLAPSSYSDFFSKLAYVSVDDDFTGSDGDSLNSDLWYRSTSLINSKAEIQSNKARFTYVSAEEDTDLFEMSHYVLTGDFDVQVDFDIIDDLTISFWWAALRIFAQDGSGYFAFIGREYNAQKRFRFRYKGNDGNSQSVTASSLVSSKLRFVRSGSVVSVYYWDSSWIQVGSNNAWGSTDIKVGLNLYKTFTGSELQIDFDNFKINSGTVIWPEGTHPNRKKIALTENDETTQCPVEIEQWDFYNGKVNLWTKVPTIISGTDTLLHLYYDKSHADNTVYVGDVGSTPAQNVWDENFVGVWHMNQDPSVGGACIKDSTVSGSHGTVNGTMTFDDLVDGKIGKALDFDGVDDTIVVADASVLRGMEAITAECIINVTSKASYEKIIDYGSPVSQNTDRKYRFQFNNETDQGLVFIMWDSSNVLIGSATIPTFSTASYYYVAGVYTGENVSDSVKIYKDGNLNATGSGTGNDISNVSAGDLWIGSEQWSPPRNIYTGIGDEFRISNIARSTSWIKATYYSSWNNLIFGVSQGWDNTKKLRLKIDNTKIEGTLTNFPVLISLSSDCGIGGYDASCIFDELYAHPYEVCDDFTWVNSSIPNPNLWRISSSSNVDIYNNKLRFANNNSYSYADSEFSLSGDFNIQIDFEIISGPSTNSWGAALFMYINDNNDLFLIRREYSTNQGYRVTERVNGVWTTRGQINSTDTSGKLCIVRSGNIFSGYFWHSGGYWYKLGSQTYNMTKKDIRYVRLEHNMWDTSPSFSFYFDNFKVNNGTPYFSSRLAITTTISGVETQCYTEIESWEQENNKAFLWTKIPTVVSGSDTELSLYYDKSHLSNWSYVNYVGTTVGKAVWDDNFVGVWHMNQDPTGGSNCIKDSTVSGSHGTPGGTMVSEDLVDGKIGKALDFDGNDEKVIFGDIFDPGTFGFCAEIITKPKSTWSSFFYLLSKGNRYSTSEGWSISADSSTCVVRCNASDDTTQRASQTKSGGFSQNVSTYLALVLDKSVNEILGYQDGTNSGWVDGGVGPSDNIITGFDINTSNEYRISCINYSGADHTYIDQVADEVRISNIARSASWVKATYYSNWDNLITYDRTKNYFSGTVKVDGVLSIRKVNLYDQVTGELLGFTTSTSGVWAVDVYGDISTKYFAVCVPESESRNAEIFAHLVGA